MIVQLLDAILGKRHGSLFRRSELKTLVDFHGDEVLPSKHPQIAIH